MYGHPHVSSLHVSTAISGLIRMALAYFPLALSANSFHARRIGQIHRALRMHSRNRITRTTADGTKSPQWRYEKRNRLCVGHFQVPM
jgi:hypothetical protein